MFELPSGVGCVFEEVGEAALELLEEFRRRNGGALECCGLEYGDSVAHVWGDGDVGGVCEVALADEVGDAGASDVWLVDVEYGIGG